MDIPTEAQLLERISDFLIRHKMAPTRFGRDATGEPQLIKSIESGRSPSLAVVHRILAFMASKDADLDDTGLAEPSAGNGDQITARAAA